MQTEGAVVGQSVVKTHFPKAFQNLRLGLAIGNRRIDHHNLFDLFPCYLILRIYIEHFGKVMKRLVHPRPHFSLVKGVQDRKSTRLNSSHVAISYAVFCLKKKTESYDNLYATIY